jgi:phosphonate transport system permease protein
MTSQFAPFDAPARSASQVLAGFDIAYSRHRRERRLKSAAGLAIFILLLAGAALVARFDPLVLIEGVPRLGEYVEKTLPVLRFDSFAADFARWYYGIGNWLSLLLETILMAWLATLMGSVGALLMSFFASRNLTTGRIAYSVVKRLFEFCRTVPDLVFALIFVFAFGLGPLPGILAIAIHSFGANGKLFADANENIDMRPVDGLRAAGANWAQAMRYGVLPQVLPNYASYALWRFELNVRSATVMGFVGAGGIGIELIVAVRSLYYEDISAILILIVATVSLVDILCERLRHHLIGREGFA